LLHVADWLAGFVQTWDGVRRMFSEEGCPYWKLDVPQQTNSSDCGLFMLHSIEQFIRDPSAVRAIHAPTERLLAQTRPRG
jgi:Ulp1 family protease